MELLVMMTFLLFAPASKRWLGWRKTENPEATAKVDFVTFIVQSYFDTLLRYVLSVTFCGAAVLKVMNEKTLVKRRWSFKVPPTVYIYINTLGEFARHELTNLWLETICKTLFLSLWGNKTQSTNKQGEWINGELITSRTMDDYRNSPAIKFCADLFPAHRCPSIKVKKWLGGASVNWSNPLISETFFPAKKITVFIRIIAQPRISAHLE